MVVDRLARCVALAALLTDGAVACLGHECTPGQQRACMQTLDGGFAQNGFQACDSRGNWSACVSVGACTGPGGAPAPVYTRCSSSDECGAMGCAACDHYASVQNPQAYEVCRLYCQADSDCAPNSPSVDVSPRCFLMQCALLCRASSTCPRNSRCLPWNSPSFASMYPGYDGICG